MDRSSFLYHTFLRRFPYEPTSCQDSLLHQVADFFTTDDGDILAAHEKIRARPEGYADMGDPATICWTLGIPIHLVPGNRGNVKITTPEDIISLDALLRARAAKEGAL